MTRSVTGLRRLVEVFGRATATDHGLAVVTFVLLLLIVLPRVPSENHTWNHTYVHQAQARVGSGTLS
jgi:hypothetical protein